MKITLFGQKWLGVQVLDALCALESVQVVAICPDVPGDRLTIAAKQRRLPVVDAAEAPVCDIGIAAHCQRFIPRDIRRRCGMGVLAYHPSLLPRHRGRDAVHWTLAMHEPITGGTVFWMDDGADTGPIEAQEWCHIHPGESARDLWLRALAPMGIRLLRESVERLAANQPARAIPQDARLATWEPAITPTRLAAM